MANLGCLNPTSIQDLDIISLRYQSNPNDPSTSSNTPFSSTVQLTTDVDMYNISAQANFYSSVSLSPEGMLWTLWPLAKPNKLDATLVDTTFFDNFMFGTAKNSRYPIGQLGFFFQSKLIGCTPTFAEIVGNTTGISYDTPTNPGLSPDTPGFIPGVQGLQQTLIYNTGQQMAIMVIKVSEQVARVYNPSAGIGSSNRYIYIGYDGWTVILTSNNPRGPMMAQTYVSPQSRTGMVTDHNYNVVLPPNFPDVIYYKNRDYIVPTSL